MYIADNIDNINHIECWHPSNKEYTGIHNAYVRVNFLAKFCTCIVCPDYR